MSPRGGGHREVERTWTPPSGAEVPDLAGVGPVVTVDEPVVHRLAAVYLDTADLALVRAGITLRRREGGDDAGWHLKLPATRGREEVHAPLGRSGRPPVGLLRLVLGRTRGRSVEPVARIDTERTVRLLRDGSGRALVELADDRVVATALVDRRAEEMAWREWEVELVDAGDELDELEEDDGDALLDLVGERLRAAGAEPAVVGRKIVTVLGERATGAADRAAEPAHPLHRYLAAQVRELVHGDPGARRGHADDVHRVRVACRRLRSALATGRPFLDREVTEPLRAELRWFAATLGEVRDTQVTAPRLLGRIAELPAHLVVGPVRRRLAARSRERAAVRRLAVLMTSERYLAFLAGLDGLAGSPPWRDGPPDRQAIRRRVRRDWRRVRDRLAAAQSGDADWHEVRKAAKRLRHACEAVEPVEGRPARRLRKAARRLSATLGEHQDTVVARDRLLTTGREAEAAGESAFTYGVLHAGEAGRARELEAEAVRVAARLRGKKVRAWLTA